MDYDQVEKGVVTGPTPYVLRVAQWYDYWPGSFLVDFKEHMATDHNFDGISKPRIQVQWDVYTSNEELFQWLTLSKRRYDLIFPSNYLVDLMKKAGMIYTLNEAWLPNLGPNFSNMQAGLYNAPADDPYDRRGVGGPYVSTPYFWGTTGLGFNYEKIPREDMDALGYDALWTPSYTPAGRPTVDLVGKMRMLDEMLDVIGAGLKKAGWEDQKAKGLTPTGLFPPDGPQWTTTETDPTRVKTAGDWLYQNKPLLFGYNSTDQATSIVIGSSIVNQAWSGDMMYAIRPDQPSGARPTADYLIPTQGSTWWVDCAAIHSRSRNLWLAHEFLNFIHDPAQNKTLTVWNLYSTPNRGTYETLLTEPFPSGWIMSEDPRLYPNIYDPDKFRVCDPSRDIGLDTMRRLYNPLWFDLVTG